MPKPNPWEPDWKIVTGSTSSEGGQAHTFKVHRTSDNQIGCAKRLKNYSDKNRRDRFFREVASFTTIDHPNVPRLIESNSHERENLDAQLYLIMEWVDGVTLDKKGALPFHEAVLLTIELVKILKYCHEQSILHRDIKPDNIILRNSDSSQPVLVDFGLSFNDEESSFTPSAEDLGNRFLYLPELTRISSNKTNPASDLTQAIGILFFSLSGKYPSHLKDGEGRLPHQRPEHKEFFTKAGYPNLDLLNLIFDRGFTQLVAHRWQSADDLLGHLEQLVHGPSSSAGQSPMEKAERLNNLLSQRPDDSESEELSQFSSTVFADTIRLHVLEILKGDRLSAGQNNHTDFLTMTHTVNLYCRYKHRKETLHLLLSVQMVGDEFVLTGLNSETPNRPSTILARKSTDRATWKSDWDLYIQKAQAFPN